jgi:hypothetical protein
MAIKELEAVIVYEIENIINSLTQEEIKVVKGEK